MIENIAQIIDDAQRIVVIQADNPDADSLGSALALEQILSERGKDIYLYCAVETPSYLRYLEGWSRINQEIPSNFDASIIVDASTLTLFEKLSASGQQGWVASKPCIVLDHHASTDNSINFANVIINEPEKSSTGEVIYDLAEQLDWTIDATAASYLMTSILGDTQGLTNNLTSAHTYRIMADLTERGVNRALLEEQRREASKMAEIIFRYKGELIAKTEFHAEGAISTVTIGQEEINQYSPLYNPGPLIQPDMLSTQGVLVGIVFKVYDDGKITAMIRCNAPAEIASTLAVHFGGGGHGYAAGFKITDGRPFAEIKSECITYANQLLHNLHSDQPHETI